jgi:hypothetical protein
LIKIADAAENVNPKFSKNAKKRGESVKRSGTGKMHVPLLLSGL